MHRLAGAGAGMLAVFVVAGVVAGTAAAAATPSGGPIALYATVGDGPSGKIVVAGAIGDWGTVLNVDKNGKPAENGNFVKVTLKKGGFEIDTTALNKTMANPLPQVAGKETCSVGFSGSGPVKLFNGTGLYKGISGTVNVTVNFAGVGGRYQDGAKKGQCDRRQDSRLLAQFGSVIGRGAVHFSA